MKIIDVVCSAGKTGFYFDDQRAIKAGAGHDGMFYLGETVTPGFETIRQSGESISVQLYLKMDKLLLEIVLQFNTLVQVEEILYS